MLKDYAFQNARVYHKKKAMLTCLLTYKDFIISSSNCFVSISGWWPPPASELIQYSETAMYPATAAPTMQPQAI